MLRNYPLKHHSFVISCQNQGRISSYCLSIVVILSLYCLHIVWYCLYIVFMLSTYCLYIVFLLSLYWLYIVLYCLYIVFILFLHCLYIVLIFFFFRLSSFCFIMSVFPLKCLQGEQGWRGLYIHPRGNSEQWTIAKECQAQCSICRKMFCRWCLDTKRL